MHEDRIRQSKISHSENRAELYLSYKDHKKVAGKTRPIATGCTSDSLALSNSVSTLVESLANAEEEKHEVISTEDLLYNVKGHDEKVEEMRKIRKRKILRKLRCGRNDYGIKGMLEEMLEEAMKTVDDDGRDDEVSLGLLVDWGVRGGGPLEEKGPCQGALLPQESQRGLWEDGGSVKGAPIPQESRSGLLEGGWSTPGRTALQEPTEEGGKKEEEASLDEMIEKEKKDLTAEEYEKRIKAECDECGGPVEEIEMCLLGLDVTALFPSMTAARTGRIVRKRLMRSSMKIQGFNWKIGLVYIVMNKHLTSDLGKLWKILPYRKKVGGTTPGMASRGMQSKGGDVEEQWSFKCKELSEDQLKEVVARCVEISVRVVFENFMYNFGGKTYLQRSGGPIGNRLTMACSRVVMLEWGDEYSRILREAGLTVTLFKIYVDDVRQASTALKMGTRYDTEEKKMKVTEEARIEDEKLRDEGETLDARMARILTPAMNSINPDLLFTVELREDFVDGKLPTLDCRIWYNEDWTLNHTYFEKEMKSQLMIPEKSAMSDKQKISILSNDLVRRLSIIKMEQVEEGEEEKVIDQFTGQLKTSGYGRKKSREIVVSGVLGWIRKRKRRLEKHGSFYRGATSTLRQRMKKKLLEPVTWFKAKEVEEQVDTEKEKRKGQAGVMINGRKRKNMTAREGEAKKSRREDPKAVIFCPYTAGGELAKKLRNAEEEMEKLSGFKIKVVEEVGEKVKDILHSSNPWRGEDCGREGCWLCQTKLMTEKWKSQDCMKRSLVYETWCETCLQEEKEKIDDDDSLEDREKEERKKRIVMYKYIGETARSVFERGLEHRNGLQKLEEDNHMMKHVAMKHQDMEVDDVKFGIRVVKYTYSAMERQVLESVRIQEEGKKHHIMNSKAEYSRCTIPRLTAKMGEKDYDEKRSEERKAEKIEEETVRKDIARRRKDRCKKRGKEIHEQEEKLFEKKQKRRKLDDEGNYKVVVQNVRLEKDCARGEDEGREESKKRKVEYKILGGEIKGMIIEEKIDWQARRQEILKRLEEEEEERSRRLEKAQRLNRSWELMRLCKEYIRENSNKWVDREDEEEKARKREEQRQKALNKKEEFKKKHENKMKMQKITDLLTKIPMEEARKIEMDIKRKERNELKEIKENVWKKWRGKGEVMNRKKQIPREVEMLDKRLDEIEQKVEEYRRRKEINLRRRDKKKEEWRNKHKMIVEDHWGMLRWLNQFIEENQVEWQRRKEKERQEVKKEYEMWKGMSEEEMIEILKKNEEIEDKAEMRKERARMKMKDWKEWREGAGDVEGDNGQTKEEGRVMKELKEKTIVMKRRRKEWKEIKEVKIIDERLKSENEKEIPMVRDPQLDPWDHGNLSSRIEEEEEKPEEAVKKGEDTGEDNKVKLITEEEIDKQEEFSLVRDPPLDPWDYGELNNIEKELVNELFGEGIMEKKDLCLECVYQPCICDMVKLEERLKELSGVSKGEKEMKESSEILQECPPPPPPPPPPSPTPSTHAKGWDSELTNPPLQSPPSQKTSARGEKQVDGLENKDGTEEIKIKIGEVEKNQKITLKRKVEGGTDNRPNPNPIPPKMIPPAPPKNVLEGMMDRMRRKGDSKAEVGGKKNSKGRESKKLMEEKREKEAEKLRKAMLRWQKVDNKDDPPEKENVTVKVDKVKEVEVLDVDRNVEVDDQKTTKLEKSDKPTNKVTNILNKFNEKSGLRDPYEVWKVERSKRKADQMDSVPDGEVKGVYKIQRGASSIAESGGKLKIKKLINLNPSLGGTVGGKEMTGGEVGVVMQGGELGSSQRAGAGVTIVQTSQKSAAGVPGEITGSGEKVYSTADI